MKRTKTKRNLIIFTVMVMLSGWIGIFADTLITGQEQGESLGMTIWLALPLLTAVLLRIFAGDGWSDAGLLPKFRGNLKWYASSFFIYPIVTLAVVLIGFAIGWIDVSVFNTTNFFKGFAGGLLINFVINIFEQSVWMGYLTSKLLKLKVGDIWLYVIVGTIWGFWHAPYYLVFLPTEEIKRVMPMDRWFLVFWAVLVITCWAVMFIEIFRLTKSIWPLVVVHMVEDALFESLIFGGHIEITHGREILISPWIGVIPALFYLLIGLAIRRYRLKSECNKS